MNSVKWFLCLTTVASSQQCRRLYAKVDAHITIRLLIASYTNEKDCIYSAKLQTLYRYHSVYCVANNKTFLLENATINSNL